MIHLLTIAFLIMAIFLCGYLVALIREQKRQPRRIRIRHTAKPKLRNAQRQLIRRLNGDTEAAERLVALAQIKYPGHAQDWYWEKAIADLERDRR